MPLPELTPEQLEQLNAISGLGKTRKRKDAPSGDNLPDVAPADLMQTALQQDDNAGLSRFHSRSAPRIWITRYTRGLLKRVYNSS